MKLTTNVRDNYKKTFIVLLLAAFIGIFLAQGRHMNNLFRFFAPNTSSETKFQEAESKSIFAAVQDGTLVPDAAGAVTLPNNFASISKDGKAYVTRRGSLLIVLLPTWLGKGSNLRGYLLCSRPLTPSDMHKDEYEGKYDAIDILTPGAWGGPVPPTQTEVKVERNLSNNIYYVSRSLD